MDEAQATMLGLLISHAIEVSDFLEAETGDRPTVSVDATRSAIRYECRPDREGTALRVTAAFADEFPRAMVHVASDADGSLEIVIPVSSMSSPWSDRDDPQPALPGLPGR